MYFIFTYIDGGKTIHDERGWMLKEFLEGKWEKVDTVGNGDPETSDAYCNGIIGIWDDDKKITVEWEDILPQLIEGTYKLPAKPFLDNGQVTEEGRIVSIDVGNVINLWITCAGTYRDVQEAAMVKYFQDNRISYKEFTYVLDDYSDIIAVSPHFGVEQLDETGYDAGGALKPEETDLAFMLHDTESPESVGHIPVDVLDADYDWEDNFGRFTVEVYKEVKVLKGVIYNIYHCEDVTA